MKIILMGLIQKVYRFRGWGSENCRFALANKPIVTPLKGGRSMEFRFHIFFAWPLGWRPRCNRNYNFCITQ